MIKRFSQDVNYKNSLSYQAMLKDLEEEKAATNLSTVGNTVD